ncbi:F0F1 ATP synthase subunit B [Thermobifida fusca]|jgi:F-type H+-transporting ATPase subunit b|uniref:ATP synthase subunit b n=2 Tax=Thermobifida fusca TaxID=2021 RepID=ATPF_THEFY|nr:MULTISPECIES: F0F1 ATP synthase subunit B [Thermobifida]Q47M78.1 RecName: Full=ATP synthase subunit b; AltName: Full=ATP synthase F(0) sector subunit b; AltName: Full=ATPase subunit I; AltName: Full=F-type ATPase subunit b; Short=F-ATPase subunit b [Thermobifida fusca YX]AAZ56444.1 ATP synthase F0, subunit B [Thermobifida fusca YX]EOR70528.1 ATP synthase F0 subunit B [Thermobifida fusca TM51]MBO2530402.1 ATP synthase subunit B [Thermobifida sp.]MDD6792024.1 F0F1 ATP synthase subunit B [Ther
MLGLAAEENVLRIHIDELVFGLIAFAVIFALVYRYAVPRVTKMLDERADAIEGGIERAKKAEAEAEELRQQFQEKLEEAHRSYAAELQKASEQSAAIIAEAREEAQAEARRIIEAAHAQIEADRQQAMAQLRAEIGALSADLAARIVGETLSDPAAQSRVIDRFLAELESGANQQAEVR